MFFSSLFAYNYSHEDIIVKDNFNDYIQVIWTYKTYLHKQHIRMSLLTLRIITVALQNLFITRKNQTNIHLTLRDHSLPPLVSIFLSLAVTSLALS